MARWKATIRIGDSWARAGTEITIGQLCAEILPAFQLCPVPLDEDLLWELENMASRPEEDERDDFDELWSSIYDWADRERVWIDTSKPGVALAAAAEEGD